MRYFIDTEFVDDGDTIDLISIGIVCEDGRELYLESYSFSWENISQWVENNVIAHLTHKNQTSHDEIGRLVEKFVNAGNGKPEFWGWCAAYDFVALCQLFGTMMDLPQRWPHYIRDIQHVLDESGIGDDDLPQQQGTAHNALEDARHIKQLWEFLQQ
jgi:hypothetical protein